MTGPAVPPGGEALREQMARASWEAVTGFLGDVRWEDTTPNLRATEYRRIDAILALDAVRGALAAQETLRRGRELAEELEGHGRALVERPDQMPAFHGRQILVLTAALRRALTDHGEAGPQPGAPSGTLTG